MPKRGKGNWVRAEKPKNAVAPETAKTAAKEMTEASIWKPMAMLAAGFGLSRFTYINFLITLEKLHELPSEGSMAFLLAGMGLAALFLLPWKKDTTAPSGKLLPSVALVVTVLGTLCLALQTTGAINGAPLAYVGAAFGAIGSQLLFMAWLIQLVSLSASLLALSIIGGICGASLCSLALSLAGTPNLLTAGAMGIASAVLLWRHQPSTLPEPNRDKSSSSMEMQVTLGFHRITYSLQMLLSLCVLLLALGFSYHLSVRTIFAESISYSLQMLEDCVSCLLLLALIALRHRIGIIDVCRIGVPLVAISFLIGYMLPTEFSSYAAFVSGTGVKIVLPFLYIMFAYMARNEPPQKQWRIVGALALCIASSRFLGLLFSSHLAPALASSSLYIELFLTITICITVLFIAPTGYRYVEENRTAPNSEDSFEKACVALAAQWGLTMREAEVFELLARGLSQPVIAERLYISPGTVHGHVVHIYQKSGFSNKQQLIAAVHEKTANVF